MTLQSIMQLTLATLRRHDPFDKSFTRYEARHIRELLKDASQIELVKTTTEGGDGETYKHFGIRRKDGTVPKTFHRVYTCWIYLGFLDYQKGAVQLAQELQQRGAKADAYLTVSPRNLVAQHAT